MVHICLSDLYIIRLLCRLLKALVTALGDAFSKMADSNSEAMALAC